MVVSNCDITMSGSFDLIAYTLPVIKLLVKLIVHADELSGRVNGDRPRENQQICFELCTVILFWLYGMQQKY